MKLNELKSGINTVAYSLVNSQQLAALCDATEALIHVQQRWGDDYITLSGLEALEKLREAGVEL